MAHLKNHWYVMFLSLKGQGKWCCFGSQYGNFIIKDDPKLLTGPFKFPFFLLETLLGYTNTSFDVLKVMSEIITC